MKNLIIFQRFIILSFLFLLQLVGAQQYPVQVTPVLIPPYSLKLGDYATTNENKLQLQLLMTDLMEPSHQVRLRFSLESGLNATPIALSNQYINGMRDITLSPGVPLILTNVELRTLFQLQNLSGISAANYAKTLPQGQYNFCFEVVDVNTGRTLSRKSCSTAYFVQYDPPMLSLPQNKELVQKQNEIQHIVFQWMPRQVAPNTRYIFTMKEIWDLQRDPVTAFLASPVLWKEEVYSNSLFYGFDKTQLLPGKRYAWQVQAKSGNPVLGGNATEDNGVYKNNGLSEIFYFDYIQDCKVPSFLSAKNAGRGRVEIRWSYPGEKPNGLYRIQYRKKGTSTAWMEQEAYQEMIYISGLADKTEYEYRVGAVCGLAQTYNNGYENGVDNAYSYSNIQYFTTDSEDTSNTVQCGMMPDINITNKAPLQTMLVANEVFTAGDFPVTVIKSTGNGTYSGEGYIVVPYLADTKVKVSFSNIQINTDRQLISGIVETTYDPTESAVHYVSGTIDSIFGDGGIKEIKSDFPIDSIVYSATPPPGTITIIGPPGKNGEEPPRQTYEGGKDITITDPNGTIWEVDKEGNITKGGQVDPSGASNGQNTDGVSGSGKGAVVNQYTAKGIELEWQEIPFKNKETPYTKFSFDTQDKTNLPISDYETVKDSKGQTIAIPYKLVVNGQTDILQADVKLTDASLTDAQIVFKTLRSGKKIEATETKLSETNRRYELTLKGAYNYQEEDVIAVLVPKDSLAKQQVVSSFKLVHLKEKKAKVHLVPLDDKSKTDLTNIRKNLLKVYDAIGVDFEIVEENVLDISNLGIGQKIESGDPKLMRTYGSDQIKINNLYLNTRSKELRYVLFVTDKSSSTGQAGYMRLNGQFGYVYKNAPTKTAAHELGHGIFKLEHPTANNTKLLMDYSESEILSHKDWQQIGDPAFKFYGFQGQEEGELAGRYDLDPNLKPILVDSKYIYKKDGVNVPVGTLSGFVFGDDNDEDYFYWDSTENEYVNAKNQKINASKHSSKFNRNTSLESSKEVFLYQYLSNCIVKYMLVSYGDVKTNSKEQLADYFTSNYATLSKVKITNSNYYKAGITRCSSANPQVIDKDKKEEDKGGDGNSNGNGTQTNEELLQKANKIIEDKIKAQFPEKNITYTLLDKNDPDYEQKLAEALKKSNHVIATLEANGELKIDFSFETPDWLIKLLPEAGKSGDTCAKEYINKALEELKGTYAYKNVPRADQIAMEVGAATYYGFFGILYCATNEESCKNSSSTVKFITGATHELAASVDVVQIVEGVVALVKGGASVTMKSYVDYYKNLQKISQNQAASPRQALEVILFPPANSSITVVEKAIEVGDSFIKNYFTECDQYQLKDGSIADMCAYRYGEITVMVVPIVFTAGEWAITKVSVLNKLKLATKLSDNLLEASIQLDRKLASKGVKLVDEGAGTVLIETKTGNRLTKIESKNQAEIEKALDNLTGSHIDDLIKDYPNLKKWLNDPELKKIFEKDFGNASSDVLKALDNQNAFDAWKNLREKNPKLILCN
ncbi:fibronectin type III domain-containing protein [Empedobacter tilapiae]|uniref:Fibronectin type-III domain-containing protein n=1 Tax=Empedobacter tilapiae TaxID=2491114 RepID=A0A4Z1BK46_9FLAO|nr:fibronectin type III domain-containing protein [Empedobacter tilapiae]TGN26080.1 hypothetical protein E4J94_12045 [Empedobacter tilapiae]